MKGYHPHDGGSMPCDYGERVRVKTAMQRHDTLVGLAGEFDDLAESMWIWRDPKKARGSEIVWWRIEE